MRTLLRRISRRRTSAAPTRPIQIVVTPSSGNGTAMQTALKVREALAMHRRETSLEVFEDLESLHRWAQTDSHPFSAIVCVGGDGTQSVTALAAMRRSVPFLPVSSGFGNLFARAFNHPSTVGGALALLARGQVIQADVGMCNGELFLCQESYGLIADVQEAVEATAAAPRARWQRWLAYYRAAMGHVRQTPPARLRVMVDRRVVAVDAALVIVANVKTYGPWLPLVPDASPVDGLLDVFVMKGATHREVFWKLLKHHLRMPGAAADTLQCRGTQVSVSGLRSGRQQLEVLRGRLPVVVAPETAAALGQGRDRRKAEANLALDRVA
jgi:diacylglycerol kinase (ATP)